MRFERAASDSPPGSTISRQPRRAALGASYDAMATEDRVSGSYAQYSGKYNDQQFSKNTLVAIPIAMALRTQDGRRRRDFAAGSIRNYAGPRICHVSEHQHQVRSQVVVAGHRRVHPGARRVRETLVCEGVYVSGRPQFCGGFRAVFQRHPPMS